MHLAQRAVRVGDVFQRMEAVDDVEGRIVKGQGHRIAQLQGHSLHCPGVEVPLDINAHHLRIQVLREHSSFYSLPAAHHQ